MKLTREQLRKIHDAICPGLNYLARLVDRMPDAGFAHDDRLFVLAREAHAAVMALRMELHYQSCDGGVGRPPATDKPDSSSGE